MTLTDIIQYPFMQPIATNAEKAEEIKKLEISGNFEQADRVRSQEIKKVFNFNYGMCRIIVFAAFLPIALPALILIKGLPVLFSNLRR